MSPEYPFDDAATARAVIDESGTLLEWNAGAERLLGWPVAEVVGRPGLNLLVDKDVLAPAGVDRDPRVVEHAAVAVALGNAGQREHGSRPRELEWAAFSPPRL